MSAPLVVNTRDGACWLRCAVTRDGAALYAMEGAGAHPYPLMATEADLAEMGIVGSADVLPVPVGPAPHEDPHDGPLHHPYRLGHDLPESGA